MAYWLSYYESIVLGDVGEWCAFGVSDILVLYLDFY